MLISVHKPTCVWFYIRLVRLNQNNITLHLSQNLRGLLHTLQHYKDNIFTNNIQQVETSINGIIFSDISDHLPAVHMCTMNAVYDMNNNENRLKL